MLISGEIENPNQSKNHSKKVSNVVSGYSLSYHIASAAVVWIGSDFYEFAYHRLGHISFSFWKQHKHHHVFFNPSPFAVIADEWIDQVRIIIVRI